MFSNQERAVRPVYFPVERKGPLTLKFNSASQTFLQIDMQYGAYQHEKKYYRHDMDFFLDSMGKLDDQNHYGYGKYDNRSHVIS